MTRRPDIDLWRGLGCLAMVISHPLRVQTAYHEAGGPAMPLLAQNIVYDIDFGAVVFFAAAGANVWNFTAKRGASAPGMARFFVIQSVLLFGLGLSYNLALGTLHLGVPDIFQGIALGTLLAYGLVRVGAPLWMVMVVVVAVFGVSGGAHDAVPSTPEGFERLGPIPRFLFAHFSFFPWAGYVAMGLLIEQAASRRAQWSVGLLFFALFLYGTFVMRPAYYLTHHEMLWRAGSTYTARYAGAAVALMLLVRHVYRGAGKPLLRSLEFAGRESFLFLVHHLAVVFVILLLGKYGLNLYVRTVLAVAFSFGTLPALVRAREALSRKRFFVPAGLVIWAGFFTAGVVHLAYGRVPIAMVTGIPAMYAFALVFPTLRARLLRRYVADPTG